MRRCEIHRLHTVTYENGMRLQEKLVEMRQREEIDDQLLLLEHPPVITLGRGGDDTNLLATPPELAAHGVRFYQTTRGGDITYHGPGQIVGYPILHLGEGNRDVRKYVTAIEEVLIRTVAEYGITAERVAGRRGIWAGNDKIAAIGVRIARWVTSHGWALNVSTNLDHFRLITPCGLQGTGVTSIERETGRRVALDDVRDVLAAHFADVFGRELVPRPETIRLVKVLVHDGERVLLLHRKPERGNFWQPVTGTIDAAESPLETAARELAEETGQRGEPRSLELVQSFMIESQYLTSKGYVAPIIASEICFETRIDSRLPVRIDATEHDAWGWFTFAEAYERIQWTDDREAFERLQRSLQSSLSVVGSQLSAMHSSEALAAQVPSAEESQTTDNRQPTTE